MISVKSNHPEIILALLTSGVSDAKLELHALKHLLYRALTLVSESEKKDHLYQVAGDIIQEVPELLEDITRSLDRTSYALASLTTDELKQTLPLADKDLTETSLDPAHRPVDASVHAVAQAYMKRLAGKLHSPPIDSKAGSAEDAFHLVEKDEVRQFAESGSLSNNPNVAGNAVKEMDNTDLSVSKAKAEARKGPPDVDKILRKPGAKDLSTLNRWKSVR